MQQCTLVEVVTLRNMGDDRLKDTKIVLMVLFLPLFTIIRGIRKYLLTMFPKSLIPYVANIAVLFVINAGCTPLNTVPILSCVKAYSKNRHFRVFIMIKIGQTHVFLKDYVHIHQIGSHFVGDYRLDFSLTGQEPKRSFCKLLALGSPRLL